MKYERMQKDKMTVIERSISNSKSKQHMLYYNFQLVGKCEHAYEEYIELPTLRVYLLISFPQHVDIFC